MLHLMMLFGLVHMVFMQRTEGIIKWKWFIRNKELLNSILYKSDPHLTKPSVLRMKIMRTSTKCIIKWSIHLMAPSVLAMKPMRTSTKCIIK